MLTVLSSANSVRRDLKTLTVGGRTAVPTPSGRALTAWPRELTARNVGFNVRECQISVIAHRSADRRIRDRHAALQLATVVLIVGRLFDYRNRWSPS